MSQSIENMLFMSGKAWQSVRGKFDDLSEKWLNKSGSGESVFELSPVLPNKTLQSLILEMLESLGDGFFCEGNFGFQQDEDLDLALLRVRELVAEGYVWLGIGQIEGRFGELPFEYVLNKLQKLCGDRELVAVVANILDAQDFGRVRGLFPDMVLAPFLCNLYLHDVDRFLQGKKVVFLRFREDFIVFGFDEESVFKGLGLAESQLARMDLELNPFKSKVVRSASEYTFRGERLPNIKLSFKQRLVSWFSSWF